MMTLNKIFGIIFAAVIFFPIIILVGMAIRNIKDEKKTELKSHLNFLEIFFFVFIESLLIILMISLFHNTVGKFGLLAVITITILLSIDGPIAVTHLIYYFRRTVYWDKKKNQLLVEKLTYSFTIDLQSSNTKILLYDPPIKGGGKGFPGFAFSYLKISDGKNLVKISSAESIFFDLNKDLETQENYSIKKHQINFLF